MEQQIQQNNSLMRNIQTLENAAGEKNLELEMLRRQIQESEQERKRLDATISTERELWKRSLDERDSLILEKNAQNARLYNELQSERKLKQHIQHPEFE